MILVKYITFETSKEFEQWQTDNTQCRIRQIMPMNTSAINKGSHRNDNGGKVDLKASYAFSIMVTYTEDVGTDPLLKVMGHVNHKRYDEAVDMLLEMIRKRHTDV